MKIIPYFFLPILVFSQPNCEIYSDINCKKACEKSVLAEKIQWTQLAQDMFDTAIQQCPNFAYAYREKSVPYLKSGDFITWKSLIDLAVQYDPKGNLGYRGWCRFQFLRDYNGAIEDIEKMDSLVTYDIGYSQNGDYHLNIVKGLSYSALGDKKKAISIIENQINTPQYSPGLYDYYQLAVTYFEIKEFAKALTYFHKQKEIFNLAENSYFMSRIYKEQGNISEYEKYKNEAIQLYNKNLILKDSYTHHFNKVYLKTIQNE